MHKLELYNEKLSKKLERRRKAISNWRRLKIVLAILSLCDNRLEEDPEVVEVKLRNDVGEK